MEDKSERECKNDNMITVYKKEKIDRDMLKDSRLLTEEEIAHFLVTDFVNFINNK